MRLDAEDIDRIAERVVRVLAEAQPTERVMPVRFVDAAMVAQLLSVDRDWVYAHADQLGAVRLGGARGRLRFDLAALDERLERVEPMPPRLSSRARGRGREQGRSRAPLIPYAQQPAVGRGKVA